MANVSGFAVEDYAYTVEKLDSEDCIGWFEVNVLHLKPEAMMKMKMLVPPKYVIEKFDNQFEAIRLKIEALEKQCDLAAQARDRLLPKLMSGELEV